MALGAGCPIDIANDPAIAAFGTSAFVSAKLAGSGSNAAAITVRGYRETIQTCSCPVIPQSMIPYRTVFFIRDPGPASGD